MWRLKVVPAAVLSMLFITVQVIPAFASDGLAVTPGTTTIIEGASASSLVQTATPTTTSDYFGKYIEVSVDNAASTDLLSVNTVSIPSTVSGEVSVVGTRVYVGDGLFARRIGQLDSTYVGGAGNALRINLDSFDTIPSANYLSAWANWTSVNPANSTSPSTFGENMIPSGGMTFEKLGRWNGAGGGPSAMFANSTYSSLSNASVIRTHPGRFNNSLSIYLDMSASGLPASGGSIKGAGVTSPQFDATAGDRISFTHRNYCSSCSSNAQVALWVGLVDVATQKYVSVGHALMDQGQSWADDYTITVPSTGRFVLALTAGAQWPGSTGSLLQTDVKFDMFELSPPVTSTWIGNLFKAVRYQSLEDNPSTPKTLRYQIGSGNISLATATQTVSFTQVDDPAVASDSSALIDNTLGIVDTFSTISGVFSGNDIDSSLTYSASNAVAVNTSIAGISYDRKLSSSLGSLYFSSTTGQWAFVPDAATIDAQNSASQSVISLALNGVPFTLTVTTRMVAPPPASALSTQGNNAVSSATSLPQVESNAPVTSPVIAPPAATSAKTEAKEDASNTLLDAILNAAADPGAAIAALLEAAIAPPHIITDPTAAVANPAIGASGDDSAAVVAFDPLGSPESIAALSGALVMAVSLAGGVAAATSRGSAGSQSPTSSGDSGQKDSGAELEGLEASRDIITINRRAWGDKLPIFGSSIFIFLDRFSHDAAIKVARMSPMMSKLIIDGAYLRAITGSLAIILPLATIVLAVFSAQSNNGAILPPPWQLFLAIALIGVFDAFAGFIGAVVFIAISLFSADIPIQASDLRMYFGVLFIAMGPGLLMTAFRALRKDTEPGFVGVWDRATDFFIAPIMAGVAVTTAVTVMPALAGLTLPVANHVATFGIFVSVAAMCRVILEEFAAKAFPARLNAINPSALPEPPAIQEWIALLMSYGIWVFLTGALSGETWQVYVGSFFFLLPTILAKFSNNFPNSVFLWRIMPQGMPGLVFTLLVSSASALIVMAFIGANPAFAAWNMILLPLPLLAISILGLIGRHGAHPDEIRFSQRNPILFRIGGVLILVIALRLMSII